MYSLPCPHCQQPVQISPSQAGDQLSCPSCSAAIQVPKLGDLRQLPRFDENAGITGASESEGAVGRRIGFVVLSLIAVASLVIAGFCGIRWALLDAPMTTEKHLAEFQEAYKDLDAARLIREYEDMEKFGLTVNMPYKYKRERDIKDAWGRNALVAAIICTACGLAALMLAGSKPSAGADT